MSSGIIQRSSLLEGLDEPPGVSPASEALSHMLLNAREHLNSTRAMGSNLADSLNELYDVYDECSSTNWDSYGARKLSPGAFLEAKSFIEQLPSDISKPCIVPEPNGDIGLEWVMGNHKIFVVSFDGKSELTFAGLLGGGMKIHGTARYFGSIPQKIHEILLQSFPRRSLEIRSSKE